MQQTMTSARRLWHPALPYALDYLGLVLITAVLSMLWFNRRLGSLLLAIPMGVAFTLLASLVFYRWQHRALAEAQKRPEPPGALPMAGRRTAFRYNRGAARTGLRSSVQPAGLSSLL